ncbi:MAG: glycerol dehydrogenase [Kiritimatiellae bacterium]|nr:glycerol dehydrogenase [Kiritimatiellia bacterium]
MKKAILFPGRYIQGEGILSELGSWVRKFGTHGLVLWGGKAREAVFEQVALSLRSTGVEFEEALFGGECTRDEARRVAELANKCGADVIVGIGGGKVCDTAKAVAALGSRRLVIVPTIAATDAPTSACTVWYTAEGAYAGFNTWNTAPDVVAVDTGVIVRAPVRYLIAGMGDALATWPEAAAAARSGSKSFAGGQPSRTALALARLCYEIILGQGLEAITAARAGSVTPALEDVVEANVLLSGIGWESGGLACAHAVANALHFFPQTAQWLHGEKVAFGLLVQFCLDADTVETELRRVIEFMAKAGLPITLAELGIPTENTEQLTRFAARVAARGSTVHNHPFPVNADTLLAAIREADDLGRQHRRASGPDTD